MRWSTNTSVNFSTGFTPYELVFGKKARLPTSIFHKTDRKKSYTDFCEELRTKLREIHAIARENLINSKTKRKAKYDQSANE